MSAVTTDAVPLRMDPQRRREQLLDVAADYITEHGVDVSLDDIARKAGISPPLMRHYFKNRDGLLVALFERMLGEIVPIWTTRSDGSLADRIVGYLDWIAARPWAHRLWMAAATKEVVLAPMVTDARRRLMSAAHARRWEEQDRDQRFRANAWVAVIESSVQNWLTDGTPDRDQLVGLLLDIAARLDIPAARQALRGWRRRAAKT